MIKNAGSQSDHVKRLTLYFLKNESRKTNTEGNLQKSSIRIQIKMFFQLFLELTKCFSQTNVFQHNSEMHERTGNSFLKEFRLLSYKT